MMKGMTGEETGREARLGDLVYLGFLNSLTPSISVT